MYIHTHTKNEDQKTIQYFTIGEIYDCDKLVRHHVTMRPQVVDEGMASNTEGSCEYIE